MEPNLKDIQLYPYDKIFLMRNRYTSLVVRAVLTGTALDPQGGTVYFTISRDASRPASVMPTSGNYHHPILSNYSSSIVRFTAAVDYGNGAGAAGGGTGLLPEATPTPTDGRNSEEQFAWLLYENMDKALYDKVMAQHGSAFNKYDPLEVDGQTVGHMGESKVFTEVTPQTATGSDPFSYWKAETLDVSVDYASTDLRVMKHEDGSEENCLDVFLFLSYDTDLIDHYWNVCADKQLQSSTDIGQTLEKGIEMKNDFKQITVNVLDTADQQTQS